MNEFSQTASDYLGRCNASLEIQFCSPLGANSSSEEHGEKQIDWFLKCTRNRQKIGVYPLGIEWSEFR